MKRTNPRKGKDQDPGWAPITLGRGARPARRQAPCDPRSRLRRRERLSEARRHLRRRRHRARLPRRLPGLHVRVGRAARSGHRQRAGHEVRALRAPLRRVLAPRVHGGARHAEHHVRAVVRQQRRRERRRHRRVAARGGARAWRDVDPVRAAHVGHRGDRDASGCRSSRRPTRRCSTRSSTRRCTSTSGAACATSTSSSRMTNAPYLVGPERLLHARSPRPASRSCGTRSAAPPCRSTPGRGGYALDGAVHGERRRGRARRRSLHAHRRRRRGRRSSCCATSWSPTRPSGRRRSPTSPRSTIRRVTREFLEHARIGATIDVDGVTLPLRPVAILLGKSINNGWGGYECCWARTLMAALVGGLEVPGRHPRHDDPSQPSVVEPDGVGAAGARRVHGAAAQSDVEGQVAGAADEPQRAQDAGAAGLRRLVVRRALARAAAVALHGRPAAEVAGSDAARSVDRRPQQPGDLVLGHRSRDLEDQAVPVRRRVRVHAGRDELVRRPHPAGRHGPRGVPALPGRRDEVRRVVLGPPGRGAAPARRRRARSTRRT